MHASMMLDHHTIEHMMITMMMEIIKKNNPIMRFWPSLLWSSGRGPLANNDQHHFLSLIYWIKAVG